MNECSLNIDTLNGSKVDTKVAGILLGEVHILERVEILADKSNPKDMTKLFNAKERNSMRSGGESKKEKGSKQKSGDLSSNIKKISQNSIETYNIIQGVSKNIQAGVGPSSPTGSLLTYVHILNIKISEFGWKSLAKGIA